MLTQHSLPCTVDDLEALSWGDGRLLPYVPGVFPHDTLYAFYLALLRTRQLRRIFWAQYDDPLVTSYAYFHEQFTSSPLFFAQRRSDHRLVGALWLGEYRPQQKAHLGLWYSPRARGRFARLASRTLLRWLFTRLDLQQVWAMTPWKQALWHSYALYSDGVHAYNGHDALQAVVPGYAWINGAPQDVYVLCVERATWLQRDAGWQQWHMRNRLMEEGVR